MKSIRIIFAFFITLQTSYLATSEFQPGHKDLIVYEQTTTDGFPAIMTKYSTDDKMWNEESYVVQSIVPLASTIREEVIKDGQKVTQREYESTQPPTKTLYTFFIEALQN